MKKFVQKLLLSLLCLGMSASVLAQENNDSTKAFKPKGKPVLTVFSNANLNIHDGKSKFGFELDRAYLGYMQELSPNFSARVVFDVTHKDGLDASAYTAYVKNALVRYRSGIWDVEGGMINTNLYSTAEAAWSYRYIILNVNDLSGIGSSADVGVGVTLTPWPFLSFDAQVVNGEGYKSVQLDSTVKTSLGVTFKSPKGFTARIYSDFMPNGRTQFSLGTYLGYTCRYVTLGGEFTYQGNHGTISKQNLTTFSLWGHGNISSKFNVFARYDYLTSNKIGDATEAWNIAKDNSRCLVGFEYMPIKYVRLSPNVQIDIPRLATAKTTTVIRLNAGIFF